MEHQYNKTPLQEDVDIQNYTSFPESITSEDVKLIMQVRAHSCLYCIKKSKSRREDIENEIKLAWEEIGQHLQMSVNTCQHRWTILRQRFSKERLKRDKEGLSENPLAIEKFSLYHYMSWLDPYVPRRQKRSTRLLENDVNDSKKIYVDSTKDHASKNLASPSTNVKEILLRTQSSPDRNMPQLNYAQPISPEVSMTQLKSPQFSPSQISITLGEPPTFLNDVGNEEEIPIQPIEKTKPPLTSEISSVCNEKIDHSQQENEDLFSFFEDDDFNCPNDSVSSFNSITSSSNSKQKTKDFIKTSSQCNSYELQREALSDLTNTVNKVLKSTPVNVKKDVNKEKYKILGQLVESHLQGVSDESYKIEMKANITRILYSKKDKTL